MRPTVLRQGLRWVHLGGAAILGTYLYSPWGADPTFHAIVAYGVFPAMALTGVILWQQRWLNRLLLRA